MSAVYHDETNNTTITLREPHGDEIELRQAIAFGLNPLILIEFDMTEDLAETAISIDATGPSTRQELANVLQGLADYLLDPSMTETPITKETDNEGE